MRDSRAVHLVILTVVMALVGLPNLGAPSLWDVDEGVNVGCTQEMMECGTWIVPIFNGELRTAKPVMLYWIQRASFNAFGISEWAARFPAFLLGLGSIFLTYELARRMFDAATGLLAGIILATAIEFCKLSHAATPDAPLIFFTVLTLFLFWIGHEQGGRAWIYPSAFASGLATLTKGPIGLAMPAIIVLLYFAWNRELKRLRDWRLIRGILLWILVAVPWYGLVISETRGAYLAFFKNENAGRFLNAMEGHRGPIVYYLGAIFAFFAPWCVYLGASVWFATRSARSHSVFGGTVSSEVRSNRFLLCWIASYLVFFSLAATKLPNYIAPIYPALALITARFLIRWIRSEITVPGWIMPTATVFVGLIGLLFSVGFLIAGGTIPITFKGQRIMPGLSQWAPIGMILIAGSVLMMWAHIRAQRERMIVIMSLSTVAFIGLIAAFITPEIDQHKAPKMLVSESGAHQPDREIRLATLDYTQPSLTFYAERSIERLTSPEAAKQFLEMPLPAYLFVTSDVWNDRVKDLIRAPYRIAARRYDFYRNTEVLVVTNEGVVR